MGGGSWTTSSFANYTTDTRGMSLDDFASATNLSTQTVYKSRSLDPTLDPYKITRECCDSEEHPYTTPVILALDVTGSMGKASVKVAQKLNDIMTELYEDTNIKDIEFCVMAIGDLAYDDAPIQISQFESDIRIAEQLDKVFFEGGGGGNKSESYTAAWYMGINHCKLDCWKRGQKGIIITLGDELPNPHLPAFYLSRTTGDNLQSDVETKDLLLEVKEKYDIYHISVNDPASSYQWHQDRYDLDKNWKKLLGNDHYFVSGLDSLSQTITNIIKNKSNSFTSSSSEVTW